MKIRNSMLALVLLAMPFAASADNHEEAPSPLTDVWTFVPKADMNDEFREAMQDYMAWRNEMEDSRTWTAYTPVISHNMNRVMYRTCCFDWADQDAYGEEATEKGFGPKFNEMVAPYVDHTHRYIEVNDWTNSNWSESAQGPYYGATTWYLDESYTPEAYAARIKMSEIAKDGWGDENTSWLWLNRIGGKPAMAIVSSFSNWADMAPMEVDFRDHLIAKIGQEAADQLLTEFSAGKSGSDYTVWVVNKDLSSVETDE